MKRIDIVYGGELYSVGGREFEEVRQEVADGIADGTFRTTDAAMVGRAVLSLLSWMVRWFRPGGPKSAEDIAAARRVIGKEFGDKYVPNAPRKYTVKAKNAQEAHEAIRPTDLGRLPAMVARRPHHNSG